MDYATCLSATWRRTTTAKRDDFHSKSLFLVKKIKDNGTQKAVQRQRMGILLCEQHFRDVWRRNKSVRAEIGNILRTHTRGSISSKDDLQALHDKLIKQPSCNQCRIKVARGPWHILSAGPFRRVLATFATSTGAREPVGGKDKLSRGERGW